MDELLKQLESLSNDLLYNLSRTNFEEIAEFMEKREQIFAKLDLNHISSSDKAIYKDNVSRILNLEPIILAKMEELKSAAEKEINKVSSGRLQRNAYDAEYQSTDGIFFDQKK